jgi:1,4-dihydroxy-2-naphthoate octaprenyltransferase
MSDPTNFIDMVAFKLAGVVGALCSLRYIKGAWHERLTMVVFATFAAYHGAAPLAERFGLPEGISGLLIGFLAAAVAEKLLEFIQSNDFWSRIKKVFV